MSPHLKRYEVIGENTMEDKYHDFVKRMFLSLILLVIIIPSCMRNFVFAENNSRDTVIVKIADDAFEPASITVARGQKVTWINMGSKNHTIMGRYFNSGSVPPGGRFSFVFLRTGEYTYRCTLHSFLFFGMRGKVIVVRQPPARQ